MKIEELRQLALDMINDNTGIKLTELAVSLTARHPSAFSSHEIVELLDELASSDDVVNIRYTVPATEFREKVILFPKGTKFLT